MVNLKAPFLFIFCIVTSSLVYASTNTPYTASPLFNSFYIGGAFGGSFASASDQHNSTIYLHDFNNLISVTMPLDLRNHMEKNALEGSLFLGYGHTASIFYLGGELALTVSNYRMSNTQATGAIQNDVGIFTSSSINDRQANVSVSPLQFAFSIRPGILLTPTSLLYGRVGGAVARVSFNSLSVTSINNLTPVGPTSALPPAFTTSSSKQGVILQLGGGLEQAINETWSIRLDYIYSDYGTLNANGGVLQSFPSNVHGLATTSSLQINATNRTRVTGQTIMVGTTFHFGT